MPVWTGHLPRRPRPSEELLLDIFTVPVHSIPSSFHSRNPLAHFLYWRSLCFRCFIHKGVVKASQLVIAVELTNMVSPDLGFCFGLVLLLFCLFVFKLLNTFNGCNQSPTKKKRKQDWKQDLPLQSEGTSYNIKHTFRLELLRIAV